MSDLRALLRREALVELVRLLRGPVIVLLVYLLLRLAVALSGGQGGLVTPSGDVRRWLVVLSLLMLGLRLVVLAVLPAVVVYRLSAWLLDRQRKENPPQ